MTINTAFIELTLAQKLNSVSSTTSNLDLLMYARAIERIKSGAVYVVSTFSSLPDPSLNLGKLYFVQDVEELFWSNAVYGWVAMYPGTANTLWSWGSGAFGRLGDNTTNSRSSPGTTIGGGGTWCQTSSGRCHSSSVKSDSTLWTWGDNTCGKLGDGTTNARSSPGSVAGSGSTWCQASSGAGHTSAVKTDGTLWTWGENAQGRLGEGTTTARSSPGTTAGGGSTWCQTSSGFYHTSAVKTDGTLWTWGHNNFGQQGNYTTTLRSSPGTTAGGGTTWCKTSSAWAHTIAVKTDGTLWTWGLNTTGRLGDGTTVNRSSPGTTAGGGTTWCQICGVFAHTVALKTNGSLWTWGCNQRGQLGDGSTVDQSSPGSTAGGGYTWCQVASATFNTGAIKSDGTLWTWGGNVCGALGDGTIVSRSSPGTTTGGGTSWCQVSNGESTTLAIKSNIL